VSGCSRLVWDPVLGWLVEGSKSLAQDVAAQEKNVCWRECNGSRAYLMVGGERRGNGRTEKGFKVRRPTGESRR
jgi:hypothetical protein